MRRRTIAISATVGLLIAACSNTPPPPPTSAVTGASPSSALQSPASAAPPSPVGGGCGSTQVFAGPGPDAALGLANNPWAPAAPPDAGLVAYFWRPPPDLIFAASSSSDDGTKVLWISHLEQSEHLVITAHPLGATSPVVHFDFPAASSPAGNYPSGIDLPSAGCWHFDIAIGSAQGAMDLLVAAAPSPTP